MLSDFAIEEDTWEYNRQENNRSWNKSVQCSYFKHKWPGSSYCILDTLCEVYAEKKWKKREEDKQVDGLGYKSDGCIVRGPEGIDWGQIILKKVCLCSLKS